MELRREELKQAFESDLETYRTGQPMGGSNIAVHAQEPLEQIEFQVELDDTDALDEFYGTEGEPHKADDWISLLSFWF